MSTAMIWQTRSTNSADTEALGEALGRSLRGGEVIEVVADLGGGKTTFVRGLARGVGSNNTVTSPTFTLSKTYKGRDVDIHHFDFYRLSEPGILADQLSESLNNSKVTTVIEWSAIVADVLPKDRLTISLRPVASGPEQREIELKYPQTFAGNIKQVEDELERLRP